MRSAKFGRSTVTELITINSVPRCPQRRDPGEGLPGSLPTGTASLPLGPLGMAAGFIHDAAEPTVNLWCHQIEPRPLGLNADGTQIDRNGRNGRLGWRSCQSIAFDSAARLLPVPLCRLGSMLSSAW